MYLILSQDQFLSEQLSYVFNQDNKIFYTDKKNKYFSSINFKIVNKELIASIDKVNIKFDIPKLKHDVEAKTSSILKKSFT